MITAVDSSALISIIAGEADAVDWVRTLAQARTEGALVCCEVVYAEVGAGLSNQEELDRILNALGIQFDATQSSAAWQAGQIFRKYRQQGGPRDHLIPDFLVGAHAQTQADRLAAKDRGYLRRYFPSLVLLQP
jgi:predicted nucleic acid-binding protein